jgi:outer membrane immunogenic protein
MLRNVVGIVSVSSLLVAASMNAASAADMPLKAPAPSGTYDWSGIYFGGNIGGGWSRNDFSDPGLGFFGTLLGVPVEQTVNSSGFLGGFQAGTNYQIGKLVVGTEADADWSDINGSSTTVFGPIAPPIVFNRTLGAKTDWTATVTTRLGIAHDRWMIYGKAGAAWENTKYTDNWTVPGFGAVFSGSGGETRTGWTVGSGIEYAFWNNWSAKLEYDYMNFGSNTATISGVIAPATPANFGVQNNQQISEVKFGINYKLMPNFW